MAWVVSKSRWRFICDGCLTVRGNAIPDSIPGYPNSHSYLSERERYASCPCGGTFAWFPGTVVMLETEGVRMPGENVSWYS